MNRTMARSCNRTPAAMLLISQSTRVLANDTVPSDQNGGVMPV
jgi:hypothetical protein